MGRAPAVALAYMWWVQGRHLEEAFAALVSKRLCAPAIWAIRQAAADILYCGAKRSVTITKKGSSNAAVVEIAGARCVWLHAVVQFFLGLGILGNQCQFGDLKAWE
jgi:hypothetical protein